MGLRDEMNGLRAVQRRWATVEPAERLRWWDRGLIAAFVVLLALGGMVAMERATAAPAPRQVAAPDPALELKREAGRLWVAGERQAALATWNEAHRLRPDNRDIAESLARAHVAMSSEQLRAAQPDAALPHLEAAYHLLPDEPAVTHELQALRAYVAGRDAVAAQRWPLALDALIPLYNLDPRYLDVADLLERALAGEQQAEAEQRARRDRAASQARMAEPGGRLRAILAPAEVSNLPGQSAAPSLGPFANASGKHIVVSINAQRMYVYEGGQLIWDWVASTGEAARPTVPGRYRVQSKIENARSNVWSLWMPYWQGIYWAGSVENGIHGQVTFDAGGRLWEGYLGTRITFGCVMVSDDHAAQLFNWTDMGTPVSIHWDWNPAWVPNEAGDPG